MKSDGHTASACPAVITCTSLQCRLQNDLHAKNVVDMKRFYSMQHLDVSIACMATLGRAQIVKFVIGVSLP